jgi:hypothetical protein
LFVGDVQVALRRLNAGVSEHQLDDADVETTFMIATMALC